MIKIGIAQARSGTFHLKHERCAPVHMLTAMPLTNTCIASINVRKPQQRLFQRASAVLHCPSDVVLLRRVKIENSTASPLHGFIMCTCKQEACLCSV